MLGRTHFLAGLAAGAAISHSLIGAAVAGIAALLPDIDSPGSVIGRKVWLVSKIVSMTAGHRTVTHTIWFCLLVGVLGWLTAGWLPMTPRLAALLAFSGALSHLVLDALTPSGVRPLTPLPLRIRGPIATGTWAELPVVLVLLALAVIAGINYPT